MSRKITQRDVAQKAEVSQAVVSLVLGGKPDIAIGDDCRKRVLAACRELGYRLPRRQTRTLAILLAEAMAGEYASSAYYARFTHGLMRAAAQAGYYLVTHACNLSAGLPTVVGEGRVDGVIVQGPASPAFLRRLKGAVSCVLLNYHVPDAGVASIMPDNAGGIGLAVQRLYAAGHRRIAWFGLGDPEAEGLHQRERYAGYLAAVGQLGLEPITCFTPAQKSDYSDAYSRTGEAAARLHSLRPRPTAVLSYGDVHVLRFSQAARELGWSAPTEVSLIGFDNTDSCNYSLPPLTSVDQPLEEMAAAAIAELLGLIADPQRGIRALRFDTRLHERGSVAPPLAE